MAKMTLTELDNFERHLWSIFLLEGGDPTVSTTTHIFEEE
jgi:hypothetical protein